MNVHSRLGWLAAVTGAITIVLHPAALHALGTPLLRLTTIQVAPGNPVRFDFADIGTGATNYVVEFSPALGDGLIWSNLTTAVITPLGGGNYRVTAPDPLTAAGFFRVRGVGGPGITASFVSTAFQVTEGGTVSPTIAFSAPVFGIVRYSVDGTAMSGDYVSLSGEIFVNGTTATIPVTLLDNPDIGQLRTLSLKLEPGPGLKIGAASEAVITIEENDADWQGVFTTEALNVGFALRIQEVNGARRASLRSANPGLFPTNEVPVGLLFTANEFAASVNGILLPVSATLLSEPIQLGLSLSAMNGITNQFVNATQVGGTAALVTSVPSRPSLNATNLGTFLLFKPPVRPSTNQVELVPVP